MKSSTLAVLGAVSPALAAIRGFNYASQGQTYDTFAAQFKTAAQLAGFDATSARLYTMIQDGTTNTPITALQAAIDTNTTLLLGLWASETQDAFNNELAALTAAIKQYGSSLTSLVTGISVGSEDLYRISPTGIANQAGVGQSPDVIVSYISQVRQAIQGTALGSTPVGHVDTWNVYTNSSNAEVISACDFLGLDEYPYYQTTDSNSIDNAATLFFDAYNAVAGAAGGKPIWITESGWPVSGPTSGQGVPSVQNAETYWQNVACVLEQRNINMWWYILNDQGASPSFGVSNNGVPLYNLACNTTSTSSSTTSTTTNSTSPAQAVSSGSSNSTVSTSAVSGVSSGLATASGTASGAASTATGAAATATGAAATATGAAATGTTLAVSTVAATGSQAAATATASTSITPHTTSAASSVKVSIAGLALVAIVAAFAL